MELEAKYKIGDYVYFIDKKYGIRGGKIVSSNVKNLGWYDQIIMYTIKGYNNDFGEDELFTSKSKVFRKMCLWLDVEIDKLEYVCQYLFPDEVTEDDFKNVSPEPLQIPEKSGFFKNIFK